MLHSIGAQTGNKQPNRLKCGFKHSWIPESVSSKRKFHRLLQAFKTAAASGFQDCIVHTAVQAPVLRKRGSACHLLCSESIAFTAAQQVSKRRQPGSLWIPGLSAKAMAEPANHHNWQHPQGMRKHVTADADRTMTQVASAESRKAWDVMAQQMCSAQYKQVQNFHKNNANRQTSTLIQHATVSSTHFLGLCLAS